MLELYLQEMAARSQHHGQILDQVCERLSGLEQNGVLHSLRQQLARSRRLRMGQMPPVVAK